MTNITVDWTARRFFAFVHMQSCKLWIRAKWNEYCKLKKPYPPRVPIMRSWGVTLWRFASHVFLTWNPLNGTKESIDEKWCFIPNHYGVWMMSWSVSDRKVNGKIYGENTSDAQMATTSAQNYPILDPIKKCWRTTSIIKNCQPYL